MTKLMLWGTVVPVGFAVYSLIGATVYGWWQRGHRTCEDCKKQRQHYAAPYGGPEKVPVSEWCCVHDGGLAVGAGALWPIAVPTVLVYRWVLTPFWRYVLKPWMEFVQGVAEAVEGEPKK